MSASDTTTNPRRLRPIKQAADHFNVSDRTIETWIERKYIGVYRVEGSRDYLVDLDEIEAGFRRLGRQKMRDGRRAFGGVPVVTVVQAVQE